MTNAMTSTALLVFLASLLLVNVEGQVGHSKARCLCLNGVVDKIVHFRIENIVVHNSTISCPHMEIIVTLKNGAKMCLNPEARMGKKVANKWLENQRRV
ncbi:C-X-C motif chemokine 11-1-like [Esox lucius]|uniref:Chemokine interleukin-8-like domain-containing protein n=1 Tax=Esox lucius TaxID=8010 RepID=A0A3P8Z481_ESOLU|nr:C-X-C motif chemokine 11-1-like [Esox lucius]